MKSYIFGSMILFVTFCLTVNCDTTDANSEDDTDGRRDTNTSSDSESGTESEDSINTDAVPDTESGTDNEKPRADWDDVCGGVTHAGQCNGDLYVWCDYHTRTVKQIDCGSLGMACRVVSPRTTEDDMNGCIGTCVAPEQSCQSNLLYRCSSTGEMLVRDCQKSGGPDALCVERYDDFDDSYHYYCKRTVVCDSPEESSCDGSMLVICDENGFTALTDCKALFETGLTCGKVENNVCCIQDDGKCFRW